jgi:AAA15 family ATPase/GTPase
MIKNIKINNYKCFKNFEIKDFKRINILVGDNNSGKTSLLEAIALLDPKTFKQKIDESKVSFCIASYKRNDDKIPLSELFFKNIFKYFKKKFEDYSIFFNERNFEKSIFIEADFNSVKKDSKSDFAVKFENKIINEIIDFPDHIDHIADFDSIQLLQKPLLDFSRSILATYKFSNKKSLLKLGFSSIGTYNDNIEGFDDFDVIFKKINDEVDVVKNWTQIINKNGIKIEEKFVKLLQNFDADIEAIRANQDELDFYKKNPENKKSPFIIPLSSMGEGFKRFFDIITTLELMNNNKPQILCIDEIDNGLYYDKQDLFWEQIIKLCEEKNIQLFATTHSYEALQSILECGTKLYPKKGEFDEVFNISKLIKFENEIKCFRYNQGLLSARIENQMETR